LFSIVLRAEAEAEADETADEAAGEGTVPLRGRQVCPR
jgi:hypothetical protein